jgi:hypothetical protein
MSHLHAFINQLDGFVNEILMVFPNDTDFKLLSNSISLLRKTNPRSILTLFMTSILPYKTFIVTKDETFFLEHEFSNDDMNIDVEKNDIIDMTNKLRGLWTNLNDINKEMIWKYFQVLVILGERCIK